MKITNQVANRKMSSLFNKKKLRKICKLCERQCLVKAITVKNKIF